MAASEVTEITFHYLKSALFRVVHADGAVGGITPSENIHLSVFSERAAIPSQMTHEIKNGELVSPPIEDRTVTKGGIVRELDVDVVMSLNTAKAVVKLLAEHVQQLEAIQAAKQRGGSIVPPSP